MARRVSASNCSDVAARCACARRPRPRPKKPNIEKTYATPVPRSDRASAPVTTIVAPKPKTAASEVRNPKRIAMDSEAAAGKLTAHDGMSRPASTAPANPSTTTEAITARSPIRRGAR